MNMKEKTHLIIKGIGWSQSYGTNWCYRYYDLTVISNDLELLALQGIYEDTFGSITNCFSAIRDMANVDFIQDNHLSETKQGRRAMVKRLVGTDLNKVIELLRA